ncbi:MAG: helix-turn-helix domain-containing protein [Betaproteobacteria bacterium]|nr:helix-turn-helix domain-containing protein [Betaproteobacteria bacterium]
MNRGQPINLRCEQRSEPGRRVRTIDARSVRRARIVLLVAEGAGNHEIARRLQIGRSQAIAWRNRFAQGGIAAISADLPRSGRKPRIDAAEIARVTTQTTPEGATRWSTRKLAAKLGISDMGAAVPPRKNRKGQRSCDRHLYRHRHLVGNAFPHLKRWRGIAARYAKNAASFPAAAHIRCLVLRPAIS